jgi:ribosomal protein L7Ae-like RNA K-turn-binding protein
VAGLIRLARKAGRVVVGIALTRQSVREGRVRAVWIADDVSDRRSEALLDRWRSAGVEIYRGWTKDELGDLAGKAAVAVLSVTDPNIAAGVSSILAGAVSSEKERQGGEEE